jgi:hypothetical protein
MFPSASANSKRENLLGANFSSATVNSVIYRYSTAENGYLVTFTFVLHFLNPLMFDVPPPDFDREKETGVFSNFQR